MMAIKKVSVPASDLQALADECRRVRDVMSRVDDQRSEAPQRLVAVRNRAIALERQLAAAEVEVAAVRMSGGEPDQAALAAVSDELRVAQAEIVSIERSMQGARIAIERLREDLNAKHDALSRALQAATDPIRSAAIDKYRAGLQMVKDALMTVDLLDDTRAAYGPGPDPIVSQQFDWTRIEPSAAVYEQMQPFEAAIREQRRSLSRLLL